MEEHLPVAVEHHLRGPQAGRATGHTQEDMVGLLPIDDRGEPLGRRSLSQLMPIVDGHTKLEAGEFDGDMVGRRWWRRGCW
jgi:hypothetical protein